MIEGIMESFRNDSGLTKHEFRNCDSYESMYKLSQSIVEVMQYPFFYYRRRDIAKFIKESHEGGFLYGPTGHKYKVDDHSFNSSYPNLLQSYEFYILSTATLKLKDKYPQIEVIGHYHDGNTIAIPKDSSM
jgi:hypothetical protein